MVSKCRLSDERVVNQFHPRFAKHSIVYVGFPYVENFGDSIVFEKLNVCNYIEHSTLMHPI